MTNSNLSKSFLWLAGTLVIGALGSGLWEVAFKPGLYWLGNALLDIGTLGLTSLRDAIYEEIARGSYERAGEKTLSILIGIFAGLMTISTGTLISGRSRREDGSPQRLMRLLRYQRVFILFGVAFSAFVIVQGARLIYINRAANHLEQLQRIVAPYVPLEQRIVYASRAGQLHTRQQYVELLDELMEVAKKNNAYIPTFDIY
ncbi:hypothetical protein ACWWD9_12500 [Methylovorus sp. SPW-M1]